MPSLFRRKPELVEDAVAEVTGDPDAGGSRPKGYTPSKKELGKETPKRGAANPRRIAEPPPSNRREAAKRIRERQRAERAEAMAGMRAGDERYLPARDRGPERALVRDIVDARRTAGTWFFGGALLVLIGSSGAMPPAVQLGSNLLWVLLALAVIIDSLLIGRRIKKLVRERVPGSTPRWGSLYLYGIMRSITFRRMRVPKPRVKLGEKI
ncbi:MAG TPA: DUF3043 domain-containing protein [Pilimelia sp.]|nr:DUF3043 domain-containing protein [Pilimelia sp.]